MKNSTSSINTYARCPKLWYYTYRDKLQPIDDGSFPASYGRAYHALQEGAPDWAGQFGPKWQAIIQAHYDSHVQFYAARDEWSTNMTGWKILQAEVKFEFDILPGKTLHGIVDGVVEWNGANYLVEYKTTGLQLSDWFDYKEHSVQPGLYLLAAEHAIQLQPYNIQGIILDVTRRCTLKQAKRTDQEYVKASADWWYKNRHTSFERKLVTRDADYLHELGSDLLYYFDAQEREHFPRNREGCFAYRQKCGWYGVCFENDKKTDTSLYQARKRR